MVDKLDAMFEQQREFMKLLQEKRNFPKFPLDLSDKNSQKEVKKIAYEAVGELIESTQLLKNAKDHRATEIPDINLDEFTEEVCDSIHYIFEILILSGISSDKIFEVFMEKGEKNKKRILSGY